MDWFTLGIIAGVTIVFMINFCLIHAKVKLDFRSDNIMCYVLVGLLTACAVFIEGLTILLTGMLGHAALAWGVGNTLLAILIIGGGIGIPMFGKSTLIKLSAGVPHFARKLLTDFKTKRIEYKQQLEERHPIKRSVYDLIDD